MSTAEIVIVAGLVLLAVLAVVIGLQMAMHRAEERVDSERRRWERPPNDDADR